MDQVESSSPHRRVLAYVDKGTPFTKSCNFSSKLLPNRGCTLGLGESRFVSSVYCDTKSTSHTWATLKLQSQSKDWICSKKHLMSGMRPWKLHVEKSLYQLGNRVKDERSLRASLEQNHEWFPIGSTDPCQWAILICYASWFHFSRLQEHITVDCRLWIFDWTNIYKKTTFRGFTELPQTSGQDPGESFD